MTQDSDDLLAMVFSAPIHLPPTQVKQEGDMVITTSESSHFESHRTSSQHEETRVTTETRTVESHSSGHHFHAEKHEERSGSFYEGGEQYHYENEGRRDTAASGVAPSVSVRSSMSHQTHHEQSYDLPTMESTYVTKSESHRHGMDGSEMSESSVTLVSSHAQQMEEVHQAIGEGARTPIAPFRTPSHDAVIEQFKSLHKRESVASSVQQEEDHSHLGDDHSARESPVKVTHYEFDSSAIRSRNSDEIEILEYQELGFEPLLRMIASETAHVESQQLQDEHHHGDEDYHQESHQHYEEHHQQESHNHHHDSDDDQFTFENVEYVHEKEDAPHVDHGSDEAHEERIITTTTTTTDKLYDPYAITVEEHHEHDDHVTNNKNDESFYSHSVYDKDHHHHRESPLLVDTHHSDEQVEIRTSMHSSGHSTLVRSAQRPNVDVPLNAGAVKELLSKLEAGQFNDEVHEKPRKEINIFESLDENGNTPPGVLPPVPQPQSHYHEFNELSYRQPRDLTKATAKLHHYEAKDHGEVHRHDPNTCSDCRAGRHDQHAYKKIEARVERTHGHNQQDEHDRHDQHRYEQREGAGRYEKRYDHYDDRQQRYKHGNDHGHYDQKIHHYSTSQHEQGEYAYAPSEYSEQSVEENQLSVSQLRNVFGGAAAKHNDEHKTHKRTTSIHRIDEVIRTGGAGRNVVDSSSHVSKNSYKPQTNTVVATSAVQSHVSSPVHHYTPQLPVQNHSISATSPKSPPPAPVSVARVPRSNNSDQFNSIRVVRNVREFVNVYGRKDFDTTKHNVITSPISPRSPILPIAQERKVVSSVQASAKPNAAQAQHHVQQKQTVVKTNVQHSAPKADTVVQQRTTTTHVSTGHKQEVQAPVPAKRDMAFAATHKSAVPLPYYHPEAIMPCCCCNHLAHVHHVQQHNHSGALVHDHHNKGHEMHQHNTGHIVSAEHQLHQHEDPRDRSDTDQSFVLTSVSERRAAYEQKSTTFPKSKGPKPMASVKASVVASKPQVDPMHSYVPQTMTDQTSVLTSKPQVDPMHSYVPQTTVEQTSVLNLKSQVDPMHSYVPQNTVEQTSVLSLKPQADPIHSYVPQTTVEQTNVLNSKSQVDPMHSYVPQTTVEQTSVLNSKSQVDPMHSYVPQNTVEQTSVLSLKPQADPMHSYVPQINTAVSASATQSHQGLSEHHYMPELPVQNLYIPATSPVLSSPISPEALARMSLKTDSVELNESAVVKNVRDCVNAYGQKESDSTQQQVIKNNVVNVQEHTVATAVQYFTKANALKAQEQFQKKQTTVKANVQQHSEIPCCHVVPCCCCSHILHHHTMDHGKSCLCQQSCEICEKTCNIELSTKKNSPRTN
ncbi:hypothetical protein V3C99_017575 [Haemonchus contortus]